MIGSWKMLNVPYLAVLFSRPVPKVKVWSRTSTPHVRKLISPTQIDHHLARDIGLIDSSEAPMRIEEVLRRSPRL